MKERRHQERRNLGRAQTFAALHTKVGRKPVDRRRIPDRRLNNIQVEFIPLDVYYNSSIE
jgi:hypothetical protein